MTKTNSSKAQYFNSHSPIPTSGTFWLYTANALFIPDSETKESPKITIKPEEIKEVSSLENSIHIETFDPADPDRSRLFILEDDSLLAEINKFSHHKEVTAHAHFMNGLFSLSLSKKLILAALIVPLASFCILSLFEKAHLFVPITWDTKIGAPVGAQIASYYQTCEDPALNQALDNLLTKLQPSRTGYDFTITILKNDQANAFAVPGGGIYIFSGLLEQSESFDEVAGIVAHEIGHVIERHGAERMAKSGFIQGIIQSVLIGSGGDATMSQIANVVGNYASMKYGRDQELESDHWGVKLMIESGYEPEALIGVMDILEKASGGSSKPEFQSSHPSPENRREKIREAIEQYSRN